ncbi:hypothetical protein [Bisbaumannia pacifica]|uniref:Lipoprotein n=1 Tax=Bisbaumannia pacifica TaxID=77098 RepID=A0A510XBT4_9GAMM|nr:hypothetical protein [Halomonas pacifica]MBH8580176.1 hypothetical protein [Halomonas pacifica]GEK48896.1 hypothetical protein HPA02_31790 [Halomonas pacifica]
MDDMIRRLACIALLSVSGVAFAESRSPVDPGLRLITSAGSMRFLVYSICSPEHCWSEPYLEWFDLSGDDWRLMERRQLEELRYGTVVEAATWIWDEGHPYLSVHISPSHGGFEPHVVRIYPAEPGKYRLEPSALGPDG